MKLAANIVAVLLGAIFIVFGLNFFFPFITIPPLPEGSPAAAFIGAMYSTGYLKLVKVLEIVGGLLLVEIGWKQGDSVKSLAIASNHWREVSIQRDGNGNDRFLRAIRA